MGSIAFITDTIWNTIKNDILSNITMFEKCIFYIIKLLLKCPASGSKQIIFPKKLSISEKKIIEDLVNQCKCNMSVETYPNISLRIYLDDYCVEYLEMYHGTIDDLILFDTYKDKEEKEKKEKEKEEDFDIDT